MLRSVDAVLGDVEARLLLLPTTNTNNSPRLYDGVMLDGKPIPVRKVAATSSENDGPDDDDGNAEAKMKALELAF